MTQEAVSSINSKQLVSGCSFMLSTRTWQCSWFSHIILHKYSKCTPGYVTLCLQCNTESWLLVLSNKTGCKKSEIIFSCSSISKYTSINEICCVTYQSHMWNCGLSHWPLPLSDKPLFIVSINVCAVWSRAPSSLRQSNGLVDLNIRKLNQSMHVTP